jgi:hypothetical protein
MVGESSKLFYPSLRVSCCRTRTYRLYSLALSLIDMSSLIAVTKNQQSRYGNEGL